MSSAARIYGDRWRGSGATWSQCLKIASKLSTMATRFRSARRTLRPLYTPGHAIHHIALYDEAHGVAFPGDVAGVSIEGIGYVRPPTPPPDLSLEDWDASISRLEALDLERLYLPHFGVVTRNSATFC